MNGFRVLVVENGGFAFTSRPRHATILWLDSVRQG